MTPVFFSWLIPCFIGVTTCLVFSPALQNDFLNWDDQANLVDNRYYKGLGWAQLRWMFTTFHMGHYEPLSR